MNFSIVIPAHNESSVIGQTLQSLVEQTLRPKQVVVVNDHSTDATQSVIEKFTNKHPWISSLQIDSSEEHLPGSKIINAFYKGFELLDGNYDVICKFDADLIFPSEYLERLSEHFTDNGKLGMVAGFCYIEQNGRWVLENLTRKDHIRGALKAYRKQCFEDIGQLKPAMGWDTVDELLAKFHGWHLLTDASLKVKHLKPTGANYNKASKYLQGEAMYRMRYGFWITLITAVKLALKKRRPSLIQDYLSGYFKASKNKKSFLVTKEQGQFIRSLRWQGIKEKLI